MPLQPLKEEHCTTLDCIIQRANELQDMLQKCQQCNLDVAKLVEENNRQLKLATDLKRTFFPDRA